MEREVGYRAQLEKAAEWLIAVQNTDDGWGRTSGLASSIVNTSEAIYVLNCASRERYRENIQRGLRFINRVTLGSLERQPRTRYALFALSAVVSNLDAFPKEFVDRLVSWMFAAQNLDGGFGHEFKDGKSCLYPTVMSVLTLIELGQRERLETAGNWIASSKQADGWAFSSGQIPNPVATSMAVVALRRLRQADDRIFEGAKTDLITIDSWVTAKEDLPGADWVHSAHMWGFPALTALGFEPYVKPIAQGVRQINDLACDEGWREPDGHLTVRGQYWAAMSFEALQEGFDPAVHVYRIDSARAHSFTLEPEFTVIRPHTKWTIVVPSRLYRWFTYALFVMSVFFFFEVNRQIPDPGTYADFVIAVLLFVAAWFLVRKRKTYFPGWLKTQLLFLILLLSFLDLVFGLSVDQVWGLVKKALTWGTRQ